VPHSGDFNLEVLVGNVASTQALATGHQESAVLGPGGIELYLTAGAYAITDPASGSDTLDAYGATGTINAFGNFDTIGGSFAAIHATTINAIGDENALITANGNDTINLVGSGDTVTAGAATSNTTSQVNFLAGGNETLVLTYTDTVVGFDQAADDTIMPSINSGVTDTVVSSSLTNSGTDTLISLHEGSTILLKGVTNFDNTFFN